MPTHIMVVDDEDSMCEFMRIMLSKEGYDVTADTSASADLMMPEMSGIELLTKAKSIDVGLDFIVMTAFASVETAIEALKKGAFDYVTKPFKIDEVKIAIKKIEERKRIKSENLMLKKQLHCDFESFITNDPKVKRILHLAKKVANSDTTILILGESGVGKEVLAKAIRSESNRADKAFVSVNCGALPENLLESELFGHVRGAFTGAVKDKQGLFAVADKGTIFLDEIGETSPAIQVKLLRALEEKIITPVGSTKSMCIDVRIIAATNANLEKRVKKGEFRPDLYYRLNVFPITIPPLRDRPADIELLANYFLKRHCARMEIPEKKIVPETMALLKSYSWPGNIRQLENVLERAIILAKGSAILPSDIPELVEKSMENRITGVSSDSLTVLSKLSPDLDTIEKAYIYYILSENNWHKSKVAKLLGIDTSTLYRKIERYGLQPPVIETKGI